MKYSAVQIAPLALRPSDAARMVGLSLPSFYRLQAAGWIKPSLHTPRLTLFETTAVQHLWERLKKEGLPKSADLRDDKEASLDAGE